LEEAYTDMLDIDLGVLSKGFLKNAKNLDLMTRAANGSEEAYRELQAIAARDILTQVKLDTALFEQDMAWLQSVIVDDVAFPDLEIGADLNSEPFLAKLTEMVNRTAMTVDQATAYLASMGVDAEIVEEKTTAEDKQEQHGFDSSLQRNVAFARYPIRYGEFTFGTYTAPIITYDEIITPTLTEETATKENTAVALRVTSANKSSGGNFKHKNSSNASGNNKPSGGGGSKKSEKTPTPAKKQSVSKTSDVTDRYHTVNEHLDVMSKAMDKASRAADRLWGKDRLKYLDKQNELLEQEIDLLEAKKAEAEAYLKEDEAALRKAAADAGYSVAIDENGVITNYRSIMDSLANELIAAETRMNEFAT
jgi:predicted metal-dependent hydrolase